MSETTDNLTDGENAEAGDTAGIDAAADTSEAHADPRFQDAVQALQSGRLQDAEVLTRQVLSDNDQDAQAVHLLGVIAHQARKTEAGIELVRKAIELDPESAAYRNTLGFLLRLARNHNDAIDALNEAIRLKPDYTEAHNNLGIAYAEAGRFDEAINAYQSALERQADFPEVLNNLGNALARSGDLPGAIERYDQAIQARADYAEAWSNKGDAIQAKGTAENAEETRRAAMACYEKATEHNPNWADAWFKLGVCRHGENQLKESEAAFRQALRLNPNHLRCLTSFAATLEKLGKLKSAASHLRQALTVAPDDVTALKSLGHITLKLGNAVEAKHVLARAREIVPADPDVLYSYANCLLRMEQLQPAMDLYLRVRELQPNQARGTFAPAAVLLMDGQYEKGWAAYESRYAMSAFKPNVPNIRERLWDGSDLNGRTLLVHVEQGFGDTIQFCRYLPLIRQLKMGSGGRITFLCEPEVHRLMKTLPGIDALHHLREANLEIVYDVQVPVLSLPHRFGTTVETVPRTIPYLGVPEEAQKAPGLPTSEKAVVRAGIVWTGRPTHSDNLYRSIPLEELAGLFDIEGVDFHSLQVGNGVAEFQAFTERDNVFDHSKNIKDFADTAAILAELDVLVTVDTAVCHLAGAMGKDVWTMVPYGGEWRWLRNREDTPWYPSMRLVRQKVLGDWGSVLERVREGLEGAVKSRREQGHVLEGRLAADAMTVAGADIPVPKKAVAKKAASKKAGAKKSAAKKAGAKKSAAKKATAKKSRSKKK